jgi:hypothetical protein
MSARGVLYGAAAGAAGTAVLNAAAYADMAIRERPASELPQKMAIAFAKWAGLPPPEGPRRTAFGALLGYIDGFGAGAVYGLVRPAFKPAPWFVAGIGLAAALLIVSEGTATAMGQTDPRKWGVSGWLEDIVPRCLYGCVTALVYEMLTLHQND